MSSFSQFRIVLAESIGIKSPVLKAQNLLTKFNSSTPPNRLANPKVEAAFDEVVLAAFEKQLSPASVETNNKFNSNLNKILKMLPTHINNDSENIPIYLAEHVQTLYSFLISKKTKNSETLIKGISEAFSKLDTFLPGMHFKDVFLKMYDNVSQKGFHRGLLFEKMSKFK